MKKEITPKKNRLYIFLLLVFIGGFLGGFVHEFRGGVFSNAQTGNVIRLGIALCNDEWQTAAHCAISFCAYVTGAFLCELAIGKRLSVGPLRWETIFTGLATLTLCVLSLVPDSASFILTQIPVNFIAVMQYNTFRKVDIERLPPEHRKIDQVGMSTTFCTNHVRNIGVSLEKLAQTGEPIYARQAAAHFGMVLSFGLGVVSSVLLGRRFGARSLLLTAALMAFICMELARDDAGAAVAAGRREKA